MAEVFKFNIWYGGGRREHRKFFTYDPTITIGHVKDFWVRNYVHHVECASADREQIFTSQESGNTVPSGEPKCMPLTTTVPPKREDLEFRYQGKPQGNTQDDDVLLSSLGAPEPNLHLHEGTALQLSIPNPMFDLCEALLYILSKAETDLIVRRGLPEPQLNAKWSAMKDRITASALNFDVGRNTRSDDNPNPSVALYPPPLNLDIENTSTNVSIAIYLFNPATEELTRGIGIAHIGQGIFCCAGQIHQHIEAVLYDDEPVTGVTMDELDLSFPQVHAEDYARVLHAHDEILPRPPRIITHPYVSEGRLLESISSCCNNLDREIVRAILRDHRRLLEPVHIDNQISRMGADGERVDEEGMVFSINSARRFMRGDHIA